MQKQCHYHNLRLFKYFLLPGRCLEPPIIHPDIYSAAFKDKDRKQTLIAPLLTCRLLPVFLTQSPGCSHVLLTFSQHPSVFLDSSLLPPSAQNGLGLHFGEDVHGTLSAGVCMGGRYGQGIRAGGANYWALDLMRLSINPHPASCFCFQPFPSVKESSPLPTNPAHHTFSFSLEETLLAALTIDCLILVSKLIASTKYW